MKRTITALASLYFSLMLAAQSGNLGLHGKVTWLSNTRIRVEYDWTDNAQLLDWTPTDGSSLVRGNGIVTIKGGVTSVHSMIFKQPMKCTRIYAQDAKAINSEVAHLNFVTNVTGWTGYDFNPPEVIGLIYIATGNIWIENESYTNMGGPAISRNVKYTVDVNISETTITAKSSATSNLYTHDLSAPPDPDRQVAVGGWGGDTEWGKLTIEGEVNTTWQPRSDMIDIQSSGPSFAPVIKVTGNPLIEWIFYDGSTSSSATPVKNYETPGIRHNLLKVTPWSSLIGINTGYSAADGGYGDIDLVPGQIINGFQNLALAGASLQYICASNSPLSEIDLSGLSALKFVEMALCHNLHSIKLGNHPYLERLCAEDCNLSSLDISGCPGLKDFRAANNNYPFITWGNIGSSLWHICIRSNPQMTENMPPLSRFPMLKELLIWDSNQKGDLIIHSSIIESIEANDNHFTSADVSGCTALKHLALSGSILSSINLGTAANMDFVELTDCGLIESYVDYVLETLDKAGRSNGSLDLKKNAPPSASGLTRCNNLRARGWTVNITNPGEKIMLRGITLSGENGRSSIDVDEGTLQIKTHVFPVFATDTTVTWSIVQGSKLATVDGKGMVRAAGNGTVRIRATANDGSGIYGEITITITNQTTNSLLDYMIGKIIVSSSELVILFDHDFTTWKACLFNLSGNRVASRFIEGNQIKFNISGLSPGLYIISLTKNDIVRVGNFVKP